jgi:hypothetical protein
MNIETIPSDVRAALKDKYFQPGTLSKFPGQNAAGTSRPDNENVVVRLGHEVWSEGFNVSRMVLCVEFVKSASERRSLRGKRPTYFEMLC